MTKPSNAWALAVSLGIGSCVLACSATSGRNADAGVSALTATVSTDRKNQDCTALSDQAEREECFALSDDYKDCPKSDTHCAPYRAMYALDRQLQALNEEVIGLARAQYASYAQNDPAYLDDLTAYFEESDRAWKASRDADCALEPFMQGMSRPETSDLTEACRVDRTKARISEMSKVKATLKK